MLGARIYEGLVWTVFAMLVVAICLMLATLLQHAIAGARQRLRQRRIDVLLPLLCRAIADPAERAALLAAQRPGDRAVLLPMLLQLTLDLRGKEVTRISELADELCMTVHERERLTSARATERSEAAKNLGLLRSHEDLPALLGMAQSDPVREVRLACAWAIGAIGGRAAVLGLLSLLDVADPGMVSRVQEVLLDAAPDAAREIVSHARRTESRRARCAAVDLLGTLRDPVASELLLSLVEDPDLELRTKTVKAAAQIGDPRFRESFRRGLSDPAWSVRCQAATGLGAIGAADAIPDLRAALDDEAWWVRFNAASSLAELGPRGRVALEEATRGGGPRCREVSRYLLERLGAEPFAA